MSSETADGLGIFSRTFERDTFSGVLDAVAGNGFKRVHLSLKSAGIDPFQDELSPDACGAIRAELDSHGLELLGVSCTFNAVHPDPRRRERETELAAHLISLAPELGTSFVSLSTGTRDPEDLWRSHPENDDPSAWTDLRRTLTHLLETARAANVMLGIEPERHNVVSTANRARRLLDELDSELLKIILDPANLLTVTTAWRQADVLEEAIELLASELHVVHAKDFSESGECGAGLGLVDFELLFELLEGHGVGVPVLLHELPEADVGRAREFILTAARQTANRT
jgi:sugar phosphate isomerase/epimerase